MLRRRAASSTLRSAGSVAVAMERGYLVRFGLDGSKSWTYAPPMSRPFVPQERPTGEWAADAVAPPGAYPRARSVDFVETRGGRAVRYYLSLRERDTWIDPLVEVDGRGRRAIEAFTALPLVGRGVMDPLVDAVRLEEFVLTFGPVNVAAVDLRVVDNQWDTRPDGVHAKRRLQEGLEDIGGQVEHLRELVETVDALACGDTDALRKSHPKPGHRDERDRWIEDDVETYARRMLAEHITGMLSTARLRTVVDPRGRFGLATRVVSLLDVMYWQLLDQIRREPRGGHGPQPVFRMPWCGFCGGGICSTRLADDKVNRWHPGCKAAGQAKQRRSRERERTS
jgi:hypothetical protein